MSAPKKEAGARGRAEITLIKKWGANPVISKRLFLDEQRNVHSDGSQCSMVKGIATAETAADLAKHIKACGTDQAIALGLLRSDVSARPLHWPLSRPWLVPREANVLIATITKKSGEPSMVTVRETSTVPRRISR